MGQVRKRLILPAIMLLILAVTVSRCWPEPKIDAARKVVPISWMNETTVTVHSDTSDITEIHFPEPDETDRDQVEKVPLPSQMMSKLRPSSKAAFKIPSGRWKGQANVLVDGEKVRVKPSWHIASGRNQGFEPPQGIDILSFAHLADFGLVTFEGDKPILHKLPLENYNRRPPIVIWNAWAGEFFAYQPTCIKATCERTAWRLSSDLAVLETVTLPKENIHYTPEKFRCFSCGCFCLIREDMYEANEKIYALVSGSPLPLGQRGFYELALSENSDPIWNQIVMGRIEPPVVFSPSGCKAAYFKVDRFKQRLAVTSLCD